MEERERIDVARSEVLLCNIDVAGRRGGWKIQPNAHSSALSTAESAKICIAAASAASARSTVNSEASQDTTAARAWAAALCAMQDMFRCQ